MGWGVLSPAALVFGNRDSPWGGEGRGWKSWRDRVPQTGEGTAETGGPGTGKGSPRGLPGMGGAARLSAPRVLVLWAALGAAGKAWRRGRSPWGRGGARYRGKGLRLLSAQFTSDPHLTPRTGGATRRISRETSCQVQPGRGSRRPGPWVAPSWVPGILSTPGVPAPPSLPQEFGSASEPQRLTMGHYTCAFQEGSGSEWVESECGGGRLCVCGRVCREGGRQVLALLGTRASVATFPASSSAVATPLPRTFIIQLSYRGDRKNYNSHGLWGSGWPAALGPAGSCSFFSQ